ncbi:MAG: PKD domain-containing protein, partial [Bacteroidota bacterium]
MSNISTYLCLVLAFFGSVSFLSGQCDAAFTANPNGCNEVSFLPSEINANLTYMWDFGDGNSSTETSPTHSYLDVGNGMMTFNVTLTVMGDNCNTTFSSDVMVNQIPDVNIGNTDGDVDFANCEAAFEPEYQFCIDNLSTTNNSSYTIDFGDPDSEDDVFTVPSLTDGQVCYTYTEAGLYSINVTIVGANMCSFSRTFDFFNGSIPAGQYEIQDNTFGCVPAEFEFFLDPGSDIPGTQYVFTTNDGSEPRTFNYPPPSSFIHTYNSTSCDTSAVVNGETFLGSYQATITVVNPCGQRPTTGAQIYVDEPPVPDFTIDPDTTKCEGSIVTFTDISIPGLSAA